MKFTKLFTDFAWLKKKPIEPTSYEMGVVDLPPPSVAGEDEFFSAAELTEKVSHSKTNGEALHHVLHYRLSTIKLDRERCDRHLHAATCTGLKSTQEPKYTTSGTHIVNRASGEIVPEDEPVFIFRARDALATKALKHYLNEICAAGLMGEIHAQAVQKRIDDFTRFSEQHPDRMKYPDTAKGGSDVRN